MAAKLGDSDRGLSGPSQDELACRPVLASLPFTRLEADGIIKNISGNDYLPFLGYDAKLSSVLNTDLRKYRILHFATHGLIDTRHPELSGLAFSMFDKHNRPQEWFLSQSEVYNLRLNAELVVLSACQTALGSEVKGEGLIGLTRGFMYAGAPRVAASLWKVEDRATAELMIRFYQNMLREDMSPDSALRQAQIGLLKQPQWRAPYFWASFIFQGLWR